MAAAGGPVVLALIYGYLGWSGQAALLSVGEVVRGILTVTLLAFIAGGTPVIYRAERLSLLAASLIHALVLYGDYILIYLFNGWLKHSLTPVLVFTAVFFAGYAVIWLLIYHGVKANVEKLNQSMGEKG